MDEQAPTQPDSAPAAPAPTTGPLSAPQAPTRARGGCISRLLSALLVIVITTFLALVAGAAGLFSLGYLPSTPAQLAEAQMQVATLQSAQSTLQTQVAAADQRGSGDHEVLGELKTQIDGIADIRAQLQRERAAGIAQSATLVAQVQAGRDAVTVFATAEAGRAAMLAELDRRSARVERFLQRLGDIASDTATDLGSSTPVVPALTPTPTISPTPAPAATGTPARTPLATPSATPLPRSSPSATPRS